MKARLLLFLFAATLLVGAPLRSAPVNIQTATIADLQAAMAAHRRGRRHQQRCGAAIPGDAAGRLGGGEVGGGLGVGSGRAQHRGTAERCTQECAQVQRGNHVGTHYND